MKKRIIIVSMILMLTFGLAHSALAAGGTGDGGGSNQPLVLESSTVPNGTTGVALDIKLTLTFSKNVVNMAVRDNNLTCFTLTDAKGGAVGIDVLMGDDQVDPNIKNDVVIKPKASLSPDTAYTLTISGKLTSKSGVSMGQAVTLTFTTAGAPGASPATPETPAPSSTPAPPSAPVSSPKPSASPAPQATPRPEGTASSSAASSPEATSSVEASPSVSMDISSPEATTGTAASDAPASNASASDEAQQIDNGGNTAQSGGNQQGSPIPYILAGAAVLVIAGTIAVVIRKKK